jgi:hypothetical protein
MDEQELRRAAEAHAQAVVDPIDVEQITKDLIDELHPQIPVISSLLPQPITSARVVSIEVQEGHGESVIAYSSPDSTVSFRSRWEDRGAGRLQIVDSAPAD